MNRTINITLIFFALLAGVGLLFGQARDPQLGRAWWPAAKTYIDARAGVKTLAFWWQGTPTDTLVAVFTPVEPLAVRRIDVFATTPNAGDTTALVLTNGVSRAVVPLDSNGAVQAWSSTAAVTFAAALPCSLLFSDDAYTGTFAGGVLHPAVVVQYASVEQ